MSYHSATKTILLVEDEALIAMNEAALLERNGYKVTTVHNAKKAIEAVRDNTFDLILMDIDLGCFLPSFLTPTCHSGLPKLENIDGPIPQGLPRIRAVYLIVHKLRYANII